MELIEATQSCRSSDTDRIREEDLSTCIYPSLEKEIKICILAIWSKVEDIGYQWLNTLMDNIFENYGIKIISCITSHNILA